jgi:CDP-glucose 4,6-dehydratase
MLVTGIRQEVKVYDLRVAIVRCGNLCEPGDFNFKRIVPETIISCIKQKSLTIRSSGKLIRDYLFIGDAVKAYILIMNKLLINKKKYVNLQCWVKI